MSSDKLDNKITEAAENHHSSYDEKAWQKMEKLLNEHLPQEKKKKRRFFFILISILLLGSGVLGYYIINENYANKETSNPVSVNSTGNNKNETVGNKKNESNIQNRLELEPVIQNNETTTSLLDQEKFKNKNQKSEVKIISTKIIKTRSSVLATNKKNNLKELQSDKQQNVVNKKLKTNGIAKNEPGITEMNTTDGVDLEINAEKEGVEINSQENIQFDKKNDSQIAKNENQIIKDNKKDQELMASKEMKEADQNSEEISIQEKKEKSKAPKSNSFFLSVSTGPDLSFVASNKLGGIKVLGGFGVGYSMKNGLIFRSGFYSGRKVYSASPDAYHPPADFARYYPILENVDADCKIYEIPFTISYNFSKTGKQNWFVGAGVSSLIMKEEKYNYTYKYVANGTSYKKDWTINNENKHLFSVLTLSGGYQRQLTKKLALLMEPYFKIPLQGVGYGKVKLNNAGVLFTITMNLFSSKEKK